ncbi:LysR family transcriptional regulator [Streptomyces sp. NPDC056910]|uniref:LysR family transcriptional regulator n=1 Tax=Streptomyces sp. NPDC056910 TaxID=3345964 RepID=UPI0036C35296
MELRHLRCFLTVAQLGTVTAAADQLHIAQPAVSRQIQRLERDLGVTLFRRNGHRLSLTDAGRHTLDLAHDLLTRADRLTTVAGQLADGQLTRITCVAAPTTLDYVLAPFVATLNDDDPFIAVVSVLGDEVHEAVAAGHDFGIAANMPPAGGLAWQHLTRVPLHAYVNPSHPWARDTSVTLDELIEQPLLLPGRTDPTRTVLDVAVIAARLRYQRHTEVPWEQMRHALAAGRRGVAIGTELPRFDTRPLLVLDTDGAPVQLPIHACWSPDHYAAAALEQLATRLGTFAEQVVRPEAEAI